ncbi:hypothetical protein [Urechidicola vernalis]|uniref:Uncharacterized protein n=1 Tax=Urechidicola vernalis TaxID=3075600 RepID=A0ABU2Y7U5_9FLAO|nr:hypothetical protein [Urechidicola sp. P050]MDT0553901.1 hypothetical protein [Urechidicola sp. P050]
MEKSIESIWKDGFLQNEALVAPKLNDLYNKKSIDIVEKFRKMYKINIIGIALFACVLLPIATISKLPYMGILMFVLFVTLISFAIRFKRKLHAITKNANSYEYLKSFESWTKEMTTFNSKFSTYLYPYVFISMVIGFWFGSFGEDIPGNDFVTWLLESYPNMFLVGGVPIVLWIILSVIILLLAFFGGRIGEWDLKIGYGRILKRLDTLLSDMEELRRNT